MTTKAPPAVYIAVTGHGFGHAVRMASVASAIQQLNSEIQLFLVTSAPHWLLSSYIEGDFIVRSRALDVGVIQSDSLTMDQAATLAALTEIRHKHRQIIASEVSFIQTNRIGLVLGDIPPLAAPIAKAAGMDCWMMGNFGWDFIYRDWGEPFQEFVTWIEDCYGHCDRLFRLPLSEPMSAFPHIEETGLTGGTPRHSPDKLCHQFNIQTPRARTVLLSFGGLGLQAIPYSNLAQFSDWQFISFDRHAPNLPNLIKISDSQLRPVDFMPLCDRLISKPGYSTFAEALRLDVPTTCLTREGFAESPILLAGLQDYGYHQIITPEQFFAGDWSFLHEDPLPPRTAITLPKNGTTAIAQAVVDYFNT
jgi:hypothetical protein